MLALWFKAFRDARGLLLACCAALFAFHWLFVWVMSQWNLGSFATVLKLMPKFLEKLLPLRVEEMLSEPARLSVAYDHPVTLLLISVWAIARGSDAISGELSRGTLEMTLAQPISRVKFLTVHAAATTWGAALLALAMWCGTSVGLQVVTLTEEVSPSRYVLPALNAFSLLFFLAGVTTLISAPDRHRWRTIGIAGGFCIVEMVIEAVALLVDRLSWLSWFTYYTVYKPPRLVARPEQAVEMAIQHCGLLLGLGLVSFIVAGVIFHRRDLPAPL